MVGKEMVRVVTNIVVTQGRRSTTYIYIRYRQRCIRIYYQMIIYPNSFMCI